MVKFGEAFAAARKAGKKEFTHNGKKYHTRTKEEEGKKAPKVPARRPDTKKAPKVPARRPDTKKPATNPKSPPTAGEKRGSAPKKEEGAKGRPKGFTTKKYTGPFKK